jgi:hypothetical protein
MTVEQERAAVFGAAALAKVEAGELTTPQEDKIVLSMIGQKMARSIEAGRVAAATRELVAA